MGGDGRPGAPRPHPPGAARRRRRRVPPARRAGGRVRALALRLEASADAPARALSRATPGAAARALESLDLAYDRHVCFIGKLIVSKGVDLLSRRGRWWTRRAARRRRLRGVPRRLRAAAGCLGAGRPRGARAIAQAGRELEGGPRGPLRHLLAFLDGAGDDAGEAARELPRRVVHTGRLEHDELRRLLAGCEALVFPSTFPEAFGMVAAEAAACGVLPVSAGHSGAAEVERCAGRRGARGGPRLALLPGRRRCCARDRGARDGLAVGAGGCPRADPRRAGGGRARALLVEGVSAGVVAAARGELQALPPVA